jgi:cysteine-rich repeat protein
MARFLALGLLAFGAACGGGDGDDGDDGDDIPDAPGAPDAAPRCGDGNVDPGEGCDDGNTVDDDACRNTCALPSCGDGVVQAGEDCDDMNAVETDACLATCMAASCGDSQVHAGVEACDDGNTVDEGVCNPDCTVAGCATGTAACDAIPDNGCETDTTTSEEHCGACGAACAPANGIGACVGSACTVMACLTPFSDCNGDVMDGCESDLMSDPATCGSCMTSCLAPNTTAVLHGDRVRPRVRRLRGDAVRVRDQLPDRPRSLRRLHDRVQPGARHVGVPRW